VRPVMTSTKKRAAVGSLSPQLRPLDNQDHPAPRLPAGATQDAAWEARIQEAVRKAVLSLAPQVPHTNPEPPAFRAMDSNPLSAAALAEAEAAHIEQGRRLAEARMAQDRWAVEAAHRAAELARMQAEETARQAAEQARREAAMARELQLQLQQQLQALAAADAEAAQAFAQKRELLARESQAIAEKLQQLQYSTGPATHIACQSAERATLPPHLLPTTNHHIPNADHATQLHGLAVPSNIAAGPAEPFNPAQQAPAVPLQTATFIGAPRPEEARKE
jgi:hypothetical protein